MIGTTIARYKVTAKLGQGGMGEVYRATDTKLNREVAIKVLPQSVAQALILELVEWEDLSARLRRTEALLVIHCHVDLESQIKPLITRVHFLQDISV